MFPLVVETVFLTHKRFGLFGGHDAYHALRVAEIGYKIAIEEWGNERVARMVALAGLCHNADRVAQKKLGIGRETPPDDEVKTIISFWLDSESEIIPLTDRTEITRAVLEHGGGNSEQDSRVVIALRDADRVVNLELDLPIRSGQHYHDIPAVDFEYFLVNPTATYREPGSALRDIAYALDWVDEKSPFCICTATGRRLGRERADALRWFIDTLQKQLRDTDTLSFHVG